MPRTAPEFFNPTYLEHRSVATCAGDRMMLEWRYAPAGLSVTALTFRGAAASAGELGRIGDWLKGMPGDALARIECGGAAAVVTFVQADLAATPRARIVKFSWTSGRADLLGRYRF